MRRGWLDNIARLNQMQLEEFGDPEIATRIAQYEMAFQMQASVPELTDLSDEPRAILNMYGPGVEEPGSFAHNCLMARRLAERGVSFTQLMHAGWGPAPKFDNRILYSMSGYRSGKCCLGNGPETTWNAGRHARSLEWRIRTHPIYSGRY